MDNNRESEHWRRVLSGNHKRLTALDRRLRTLPAAPRCKMCGAPFRGPFSPVLKLAGFRRWAINPQLCRYCANKMTRHRGGADVPVSVMFADVRGSTSMAETMSSSAFTGLIDRFYEVAFDVIDGKRGVIDHLAGDGVMAMWIPLFTSDHIRDALGAGELILSETARVFGDRLPIGAGVHTGTAYVGIMGHDDSLDFTVIGDVPNTVARLSAEAAAGELMVSNEVAVSIDLDTTHLREEKLTLKGKSQPIDAWRMPASSA